MGEYDPSRDLLVLEAESAAVDRVTIWHPDDGRYIIVSAYEAFEIAGRIQAAAVRAMQGLDAPATYSPDELARIEKLKRVIPE